MPMGFKNAPAIFQRKMDQVLKEEIGKGCHVYVDDILIFGKSESEHDASLKRVQSLLEKHGLAANEKKCEYRKEAIEFLGYRLSKNKIEAVLEATQGVDDFPKPANKKDLQSFLGIVNYYCKFIESAATIGKPLYDLLRKDSEFIWTAERQQAFDALRKALLSPKVLAQPDYTKPFILETDASNVGIGAILSQITDGVERPVAYASRKLIPAEVNYSISEKECLAAIWGMESYEYFLYGTEFVLRTDRKALEKLNAGPLKSARIERWSEGLQCHSFTVEYRKGETLPHVDALSRNFEETNAIEDSPDERRRIILAKHEELVFRGAKAVNYALEKEYSWKGMFGEIKETLKGCVVCKKYNVATRRPYRKVDAFERVAFDIMGPIGNHYVISAIDYFTRQALAKRIMSRKKEKVLEFLQSAHNDVGIKNLVCDQAKENMGSKIRQWAESKGIKIYLTTPYHHESNGRIERLHSTVMDGVNKGKFEGSHGARPARVVAAYNQSWHSALEMSPIEACSPENWVELRRRIHQQRSHQKITPLRASCIFFLNRA
ncbi:hypothetical protein PAPHI01_0458 [Pancytospora philotis]|nr:hypothetical protein PAPHI01_0458 [Pancytospora philotis]